MPGVAEQDVSGLRETELPWGGEAPALAAAGVDLDGFVGGDEDQVVATALCDEEVALVVEGDAQRARPGVGEGSDASVFDARDAPGTGLGNEQNVVRVEGQTVR